MNDQKQQNGNRQNQQNTNQQNNNQQRKDLPKIEPKKELPLSQPKMFNSPAMEPEPAGQKYVSIAIIAFLLGFGAAALWFGDATSGLNGPNATSTTATSTEATNDDADNDTDVGVNTDIDNDSNGSVVTTPDLGGLSGLTNDEISVDNQVAGLSVLVRSVTLTEPSWLAVSEPVEGGVRILGAKLVDVGTTMNVKIDLLRGTLAGKSYMVVVRADNGDHVFVPSVDQPAVGSNQATFTAQ